MDSEDKKILFNLSPWIRNYNFIDKWKKGELNNTNRYVQKIKAIKSETVLYEYKFFWYGFVNPETLQRETKVVFLNESQGFIGYC